MMPSLPSLRGRQDILSPIEARVLVAGVLFFYYIQLWGLVYTVVEGWDLRVAIEFIVVTYVRKHRHRDGLMQRTRRRRLSLTCTVVLAPAAVCLSLCEASPRSAMAM
jgi:hypothetical protein